MKFHYEDLSTKRPFHDCETHPVGDGDELRQIVDSFSNEPPRILKLKTSKFEVYFGVGTDPSFIECFNWETGQAKYPVPENLLSNSNPPTFTSEFETLTPPICVLWPFSDVWQIVEFLMLHDELPADYKWELTPDWEVENAV